LQDGDAVDWVRGKKIDADHPSLRYLAAHNLAPATRRDAEIDDCLRALEQSEPLVEFEQFECCAAPVILRLCPLYIGVVQLPFEPAS